MWSWINSLWLVALGAGLALGGLAAVALAWWLCRLVDRYIHGLVERQSRILSDTVTRVNTEALAAHEQTLAAALELARLETEARVSRERAEAETLAVNMRTQDEKRGVIHWGAVKAAEAVTDVAVQLATDIQVQQARLNNLLLRVDWIRDGGNPEANWNEIVDWHNKGRKKKH